MFIGGMAPRFSLGLEVVDSVLGKILKGKFLRTLVILIFLVLPILYFLFSVIFFQPFESKSMAFHDAIPANVDFFIEKVNFSDDFYEFPKPELLEAMERTAEWDNFVSSAYFREMTDGQSPTAMIDDVRESLEQVPIDVLENVLGNEIALAGSMKSEEELSWTAMVRVTRTVKFAYEAMSYGLIRGFLDLPFEVEEVNGQASWLMEDGTRLFVHRHLDMVVVTNDELLLAEVEEAIEDITKSLGFTTDFNEGVLKRRPDPAQGEVFSFSADLKKAVDGDQIAKDFADSPDLGVQVAASLFDARFFERMTGFFDLNSSAVLRTEALIELDRQRVSSAKTGVYSASLSPMNELWGLVSAFVPLEDTFLVTLLNAKLRNIFNLAESKMEPDLKQLINDALLDTQRYTNHIGVQSLSALVDFLDEMLGDQVLFFLTEPGEWKNYVAGGQVGESLPWPRIGIIAPLSSPATFEKLIRWLPDLAASQEVNSEGKSFKVTYPKGTSNEYLEIPVDEELDLGVEGLYFGRLSHEGQSYFVFTTSSVLYHSIINVTMGSRSVADDPLYAEGEKMLEGRGSGLVLFNSGIFGRVMNGLAEEMAKENSRPDWDSIRPQERSKVVAGRGLTGREIDVETEKGIEEEVTERLMKMESQWLARDVPKEAERIRDSYLWMELIKGAVLRLRAEPERLDLKASVVTAVRR